MLPFDPLFRNPHLATIAGNFWRRPESEARWPVRAVPYRTEPEVRVMVHSQTPEGTPRGHLVMVHGLEGSHQSGYERSMAWAALDRGWASHRFNMRGCGGSEELAVSSYHAGQTGDLAAVLRELRNQTGGDVPIAVVGFSLGANVTLKLAGELGEQASELIHAVCAVSAPIDLAACAAALTEPRNKLYQDRFLDRLKARIRLRHVQAPEIYTLEHLPKVRTIEDFDDYYTARLFGFGTAQNYFRTQSSGQYLERIRIPALLIQAQDDPMIPFRVYDHPAFSRNPRLQLVTPRYGGHLGFLSRRRPRFWVDETVLGWLESGLALVPGNIGGGGNVL